MRSFKLKTEYITLGQFLKAANVIGSGGEARGYLAENTIIINGEQDQRRGRKLRLNDVVTLPSGDQIQLIA